MIQLKLETYEKYCSAITERLKQSYTNAIMNTTSLLHNKVWFNVFILLEQLIST